MLSGSKILQGLESRKEYPEPPSQKTGLQCRNLALPQSFASVLAS